jgi:DNA-binding transcriptional ArsR family regulator
MSRCKSSHSQANSDFEQSYFLAAKFLLCFSNSTALLILNVIRKKESTLQELSQKLGITYKTVVSKLKIMEREGILTSYSKSKTIFYRVSHPQILRAFDRILAFAERKLKRDGSTGKAIRANRPKSNRSSKTDQKARNAAQAPSPARIRLR